MLAADLCLVSSEVTPPPVNTHELNGMVNKTNRAQMEKIHMNEPTQKLKHLQSMNLNRNPGVKSGAPEG